MYFKKGAVMLCVWILTVKKIIIKRSVQEILRTDSQLKLKKNV